MSQFWATLALGIVIGLFVGSEIARRAYKDVAARLSDSNELLGRMLDQHGAGNGEKHGG